MQLTLRLLFLLSTLLATLPLQAQNWLSVTRNGAQFEEQSRSVAVDAAGNSYIAGFFVEQTTFGTNAFTAYGGAGADIYVAKYGPTGTLLWTRRAGGIDDDFAFDIAVDASGNAYVIGHFQGIATFGTQTVTSAGVYDVYVAKYNTTGDVQWVQRFGGASSDLGYSLALDPNGNIFISGSFLTTTSFGSTSMTSAGGYDAYVAKLDPSGNALWAQQGGGLLNDNANQIATDPSGNCMIIGNFMSVANFNSLSVTSAGNGDIYVAKYNGTGTIQWLKRAGNFREDIGYGIGSDNAGNVYVSGFFQEPVSYEGIPLSNSGFYDIFIAKYTPAGVIEWAQRAGGTQYDNSFALHVEPNGEVYIGGYFQGTATFGTYSVSSSGAQDIYVAKYSTTGTALWAKSAGGPQYDNVFGIALAPSGNSHVTGFFSSTAFFSPYSVTSAGSYDSYMARLSPACGVVASAGADANLCSGQSVSLGAAALPGHTYSWSVSPAIPGFSSSVPNPTVTLPTVSSTVQYTFTVTASFAGCPSATDVAVVTVSPVPAVAVLPAAPTICQGNSVTLSATGATAYTWTPATGLNGSTGAVVIASPNFTTSYQVTGTTAGCTGSPTTITVAVTPLPAAPAASNNGPACPGTTVSLGASTVSGATYSWVGPGNFSSLVQNPTVPNIASGGAGTYAVYAISNIGCISAPGTTNVIVQTAPPAPVASSNSPVCAGSALQLQASTVSGSTYSWAGPGSFSSLLQNPTIANTTASAAGTYTAYAVGSNGCASAVATTVVSVTPVAAVTAFSNGPVCMGTNLTLSATPVSGATYSWAGPSAFTSTSSTPTVLNFGPTQVGDYTVYATLSGCTAQSTVSVAVLPLPAAPVATVNSLVCSGGILELSATTVANSTYSWAGPGSFSSTSQFPQITGAAAVNAGVYSVYAVLTTNGCVSDAGTVNVAVVQTPVAAATNNGPVCAGNPLLLTAAAAGNATYSWTGPDNFTSTLQNPVLPNSTMAMSGAYFLTVSENGCSSTDSTIASVNTTPFAPAVSSNGPVCSGSAIAVFTNAVPGATYSWTTPLGGTLTGQIITVQNATAANAGTYTLQIQSTGACVYLPAYIQVDVNTPPTAPVASINGPVCDGGAINLSATSAGAATYSWSGPAGFSATGQTVSVTGASAANAGVYTVHSMVPGCPAATATVAATITPLPVVTATADNTILCAGATTQLSASGATTYTWSPAAGISDPNVANPSFTASANTQLVVTGTENGCSNTATVSISVLATPVISITATADTIGVGSGTQLTATATGTGPFTYAWSPAAGLSDTTIATPTATPAGTTTYLVTVTDQSTNCSATSSITIVVSSAEEELAALGLGLSVYPNPFGGQFSAVITSGNEQQVTLMLYDLTGRLINTRRVVALTGETTVRYDLGSTLSDGVYLLSIQTEKQQLHVRMVKQQ